MSTGGAERRRVPDRRGLTLSSIAFVVLLVLAVVWPSPVLWLNERTLDVPLAIDEHSFLGREAPHWDLVFWGLAGVLVLAMFHGRTEEAGSAWREFSAEAKAFPRRVRARWRSLSAGRMSAGAAGTALLVGILWWFLDSPLIGMAERADSPMVRDVIRLFNRLGGGMNPVMIIFFFGLAGALFAHLRWARWALAMAAAGAGAGIVVHILKVTVGRTRPEMWLGPFHHVFPSASSFPSGHTVGAFAIAGVLLFGSRSRFLQVASVLVASAVACSRVLTFRHWPSDVVAAAFIGLAFGWFFVTAMMNREGDAVDNHPTTVRSGDR